MSLLSSIVYFLLILVHTFSSNFQTRCSVNQFGRHIFIGWGRGSTRCSPNSMFPSHMFPDTYVPRYIYFPRVLRNVWGMYEACWSNLLKKKKISLIFQDGCSCHLRKFIYLFFDGKRCATYEYKSKMAVLFYRKIYVIPLFELNYTWETHFWHDCLILRSRSSINICHCHLVKQRFRLSLEKKYILLHLKLNFCTRWTPYRNYFVMLTSWSYINQVWLPPLSWKTFSKQRKYKIAKVRNNESAKQRKYNTTKV